MQQICTVGLLQFLLNWEKVRKEVYLSVNEINLLSYSTETPNALIFVQLFVEFSLCQELWE